MKCAVGVNIATIAKNGFESEVASKSFESGCSCDYFCHRGRNDRFLLVESIYRAFFIETVYTYCKSAMLQCILFAYVGNNFLKIGSALRFCGVRCNGDCSDKE